MKGDKSNLSPVELDCQSHCQHPACQLSQALSASIGMQLANGAVQKSPLCVLIEVNGLTPGRNPVQPLGLETIANPAGSMFAMIMAAEIPCSGNGLGALDCFCPVSAESQKMKQFLNRLWLLTNTQFLTLNCSRICKYTKWIYLKMNTFNFLYDCGIGFSSPFFSSQYW